MALLNITRWPTALIFVFAGIAAATFAFVTVNLFSQAMASLDFLKAFGWEAIRHGALRQVAELVIWGALSLSCWLLFKLCEHVLEDRYLDWARRSQSPRRDTDR
ncbi:hypothetical protein [Antarctobacter sp.]|uniref:hypothetical protein n=1 Tax=Antarctobacter sp. TaxID=1872577 RepID=UPI003A8F6E7A